MTHKDELNEKRKEYFQNATLKQKFVYFWEYYKIHTFIILFLVISACYLINHFLTVKSSAINGMFLNIDKIESDTSVKSLGEEFIELQEIDTSKYEVRFNDGYTLTGDETIDYENDQAIWVQTSAGEVDFMIGPHEYTLNYGYQDYFYDLRTILSEEQIAKYEQYFLYVDVKVMEELSEQSLDLDAEINIEFPASTNPDEMKEPIPAFIDLSQCEKITNLYGSRYDSIAFSIPANAKNLETALAFLDYLME